MTRAEFAKYTVLAGGSLIWSPVFGHGNHHPHHAHWIVPHSRPPRIRINHVQVSQIAADVQIVDQVATTILVLTFQNKSRGVSEGRALLPVPQGASLRSFALEGAGNTIKAELLPRKEARKIYDEIVRSMKDPAILEFAGLGAVQTGVFPVPAGGEVKLRIKYDELLTSEGDRIDYLLPRTEAMDESAPAWLINFSWKHQNGIRTLYSPTHQISSNRKSRKKVDFALKGEINPGSLRVSILQKKSPKAVASFLSYPEGKGEGYFLMLLSPPEKQKNARKMKREVTLVIDRSGSMAGAKVKQVKAAARQVLGGLSDGERFNLITYNEAIESFAPKPIELNEKSLSEANEFLNRLRVSGGTNIHDALSAALSQPTEEGFLPMVLFLTDGLPTIGETSEKTIRKAAEDANKGNRRVFTFGVGVDVNTPLLSRIADDTRAVPTFVLPEEDVELKVSSVFRRLSGPVLSEPKVSALGQPGRISDLLPARLPDFYELDQVILVGRYHGEKPLEFELSGTGVEGVEKSNFKFDPKKMKRAEFVPRLWATRKIAVLTEALRDLGADASMRRLTGNVPSADDPRVKELVDEIVRLSTEFGILTEYTAFLAREGEVFNSRTAQNEIAAGNFSRRAIRSRSGRGGVNQELNLKKGKWAGNVDKRNSFVNEDLVEEEVKNVQQIGRKTFYARGNQWVDADAVDKPAVKATPVEIGSEEFFKLVDRLIALNQQSSLALGPNTHLMVDGKLYELK